MDVVTPEQARIAEDAGAVAVMALERVPADIRAQGGVSRMSDPDMIDGIIEAVSIPVMAKAWIGHFVEAQVLQQLGVDFIDESEVLSPPTTSTTSTSTASPCPSCAGATNLGEALRRITEGAAMIRSKGEAGTGDVSEATKHIRTINAEIRALSARSEDEPSLSPRRNPPGSVRAGQGGRGGRCATRADVHRGRGRDPGGRRDDDAARGRRGVRRPRDLRPASRRSARPPVVRATVSYDDAAVIAEVSRALGEAMVGINVADLPAPHRLPSAGGERGRDLRPAHRGARPVGDARARAHARAARCARVTAVRRPAEPRSGRRPGDPWRGVDGHQIASPGSPGCASRCGRDRGRPAGARHLRGLILLAERLRDGVSRSGDLRRADVTVRRNAFGRQTESFETDLVVPALEGPRADGAPVRAAFIRAPLIEEIGPAAELLAALPDGRAVAARQGRVFRGGLAFHPESTGETRFHGLFLRVVREG